MATVEQVKTKLEQWGYAVAGGVCGHARIVNLMASSTGTYDSLTKILLSPEVEQTERAVCMLSGLQRAVVIEHYTQPTATAEQHWQAVQVSKSGYYRALDAAYTSIADNLAQLDRQAAQGKTRIHSNNYKKPQSTAESV